MGGSVDSGLGAGVGDLTRTGIDDLIRTSVDDAVSGGLDGHSVQFVGPWLWRVNTSYTTQFDR